MRVYELARKYNMKSKDFMSLVEEKAGLHYPSHMSSVEAADEEKIHKLLLPGAGEKKESGKGKAPAKGVPHEKKQTSAAPSAGKEIKSSEKANQGAKRAPAAAAEKSTKQAEQKQERGKERKAFPRQEKKQSQERRRGEDRQKMQSSRQNRKKEENSGSSSQHKEKRARGDREAMEGKFDRRQGRKRDRRKQEQGQEETEAELRNFKHRKSERPADDWGDYGRKPARKKAKKRNKKAAQAVEEEDKFTDIIEIPEDITVGDFAKAIHKNAMDVIGELIKMGVMAGLNDSINFETADAIAEKFGLLITEPEKKSRDEIFDSLDFEDKEEDLKSRPPVVTVMGHVDHGKTTLLDQIRKTNVTRGEAGGITQHIGASEVNIHGHRITFLDTPGHEAFTQMRAHGAETTDIVILVVAADDGVMPQTVEAINHAKAAKVPIIVAINKMDKYGADPNRVMQELMEYGLVPEEWGGDTIMMPISAKTGKGVEDLLEMVITVAELEELKANPNRPAVGVIIEAQLEKGRGATSTVLVQKGTLHDNDYVVSGQVSGHIRAMYDAHGRKIHKATPSQAAKIVGLSNLPETGDAIYAVADEKVARDFAAQAQERERKNRLNMTTHVSLDELHNQISEAGLKELNIIVKTDVKGTIDALASSLEKMSNEEVRVNIIHGAVGGISESDVMLAAASNAIIIGFNVRPNQGALAQAERENIDIRTYRVIYEAIEDIDAAIKGMLAPEIKEEILGHAEVRDTFKVPNVGTVAGIYVTQGKMQRNAMVRLIRDNVIIYEGKISSLRRFKDDVKEVTQSYEGGLGIENYNDIKTGDQIECFHQVEVKAE